MHRILRVCSIVVFLTLCLLLKAEPADEFLKAYFLIQEGDAAEKGQDWPKAIEKFSAASKVLRDIRKSQADWNPNIINYRQKYCVEHILKVGGKVDTED